MEKCIWLEQLYQVCWPIKCFRNPVNRYRCSLTGRRSCSTVILYVEPFLHFHGSDLKSFLQFLKFQSNIRVAEADICQLAKLKLICWVFPKHQCCWWVDDQTAFLHYMKLICKDRWKNEDFLATQWTKGSACVYGGFRHQSWLWPGTAENNGLHKFHCISIALYFGICSRCHKCICMWFVIVFAGQLKV